MDKVQSHTDGDYCLPHLCDLDRDYAEFFISAKAKGRYIIMDNSLHELGSAYSTDRLMHWIDIIKPQEFIVPDVWMDCDKSVKAAKHWINVDMPPETTKVAVVQASSIYEAIVCCDMYKNLGYKKLAFSYGADYYGNMCPHPNKDLGKALGRISVISRLYSLGSLQSTDRVHLLGTCVPGEFQFYSDFPFIESIDTSSPVMAGLEKIKYVAPLGLTSKPKTNMNTAFTSTVDDETYEVVLHNIKMFKTINNL
jgi:hypothetical protein